MKSFKFDIYKAEILLIFIIGLIPLLWFKSGFMGLGHDMGFPLAPLDYFQDRLFAWTDRVGSMGTNQTDSISGIFVHGLEALFTLLGFSLIVTQKMSFVFWFVLPGITMYILLRSLNPKKEDYLVRITGSVFYMLNHYLLQGWIIAEKTKFSIVAVLPLVILILVNVFIRKKNVLKQAILLSLLLFVLNGGAGIPLWGGLFIAGTSALIMLLLYSKDRWWDKIKRVLSFGFLSVFFLLILNLYWVYPYFNSFAYNFTTRLGSAGGVEGAVNWSHAISWNASYINVFRLQGIPDWYGNSDHPYANNFLENPIWILASLIFPLVALMGLLRSSYVEKDIRFYKVMFLVILLVGVLFTAGSHPPFGFLYDMMLREIPGFAIFRTPFYKFAMVVWFAYAYLFGLGVKNIADFLKSKVDDVNLKKWLPLGVLVVFTGFIFVYNYPVFTGSFFDFSKDYSTKVVVPEYIFDSKTELDKNKFSTRTLYTPDLNSLTFEETYDWRYFSLSTIPSMLSRRSIVINDAVTANGPEMPFVDTMYDQIYKTGNSSLISFLGVDRIILRNDFKFQKTLNYLPNRLKDQIRSNPAFSKYKSIGKWDFYDVLSEPRPIISASKKVTYIESSIYDAYNFLKLPELQLYSPFVVSNARVASLDQNNLVSEDIIQARCVSCPRSVDEFKVDLTVPRILPGSRLYWIVKKLRDVQEKKLTDPQQKIDFILGDMNKDSGAVLTLVNEKKVAEPIKQIVDNWYASLDKIKQEYPKLTPAIQEEYSHKIYYYLRAIFLRNNQVRDNIYIKSIHKYVDDFNNDVRKFIQELHLSPLENDENDLITKYHVNLLEGEYKLNLFLNPQDATSSVDLKVFMDTKEIKLVKIKEDLFQSEESMRLSGGQSVLVQNNGHDLKDLAPIRNFQVKAEPSFTRCNYVDVPKLATNQRYKIDFIMNVISGGLPQVAFLEKNSDFPDGMRVDVVDLSDNPLGMKTKITPKKFEYLSTEYADNVTIRFCVDASNYESAVTEITDLTFVPVKQTASVFFVSTQRNNGASPKINFVAINQTKYLVKVVEDSSMFVLNLNSRYDSNWKIRKVDPVEAEKYFIGDVLTYQQSNAVEFARQDKHVLTDLTLKTSKDKFNPEGIWLNGFSNGWIIDKANKGDVYLIEYGAQNDLYKTSLISLVALVSLVSLFLILSRRKDKEELNEE